MKKLFLLLLITNSLFAQPGSPQLHKNGKYGYVKADGSWLAKPKWQEARPYNENRAAVRKGDYWGFLDEKGKVAVKPRYYKVHDFHSGFAVADGYFIYPNGAPALRKIEGDPVVWVDDFHGEVAFVRYEIFWKRETKNYTLINRKGQILLACIQSVGKWKDGRCKVVHYTNKNFEGSGDLIYVYIDSTGREVSPACRHDFDLDQAPVLVEAVGGKQAFIDKKGQALTAWHDKIEVSRAGYIFVKDYPNQQLVYTPDFQPLVPKDNYSKLEFWTEKILMSQHATTKAQQFWATDRQQLLFYSKTPLKPLADAYLFEAADGKKGIVQKELSLVHQGLDAVLADSLAGFIFCKNGTWGYWDRQWQEQIPPQYDTLITQSGSAVLLFKQQGKWGAIDRTNRIRIPAQHSYLAFVPGKSDVLEIKEKNRINWIDLSGKKQWASGFERVDYRYVKDGFLIIKTKDNYEGVADLKGKILIQAKHEKIDYVEPVFIASTFIGDDFLFDKTGKSLLKVDDLAFFHDPQMHLLLLMEEEDFKDPQFCFLDLKNKKLSAVQSCDNLDWRNLIGISWAMDGVIQLRTQAPFQKAPGFIYFFQTNRGFWNRTCTNRTEYHSGKGRATAYNIFKFVTVVPLLWDVAVGNDPITKPKSYTTVETDCMVERYTDVGAFSEGMIAVQDEKTGLWGYLNSEGKKVIAPKFTTAGAFEGGRAQVEDADKKLFWIDTKGNKLD